MEAQAGEREGRRRADEQREERRGRRDEEAVPDPVQQARPSEREPVAADVERVRQGLEKELKSPQVTISMREVRPGANRITVTGAVRAQNAVDLRDNWHVSDAVA